MNDRFDLGSRRNQNVVLGLNEEKQCDNEDCCRPKADGPSVGSLSAGIYRSQNRGGANASQRRYDNQPIQGAVHFTANEPEEKHRYGVVRLHSSGVNTSAEKLPPVRQQELVALRAVTPFDAL